MTDETRKVLEDIKKEFCDLYPKDNGKLELMGHLQYFSLDRVLEIINKHIEDIERK